MRQFLIADSEFLIAVLLPAEQEYPNCNAKCVNDNAATV